MVVFLNGEYVDSTKALVSVWDHGFLYGDGVFEGIRAYNGRVFKLEEHIRRLYRSAHTLMISIPMSEKEMMDAVVETCRKNELRDAYIRLIISRGPGDMGIDPRKCNQGSTVVIVADKIALYPQSTYDEGLNVISCSTRKTAVASFSPQIKSLNYLNNIMGKLEAIQAGAAEAIMISHDGYVTECTTENIFLIDGEKLITPPVFIGILEGVTRNTVMDLGKTLNLTVEERLFGMHEVYNADECFVTGTGAELLPVVKVDGRLIGTGKPGKITKTLLTAYKELVTASGVEIYEGVKVS